MKRSGDMQRKKMPSGSPKKHNYSVPEPPYQPPSYDNYREKPRTSQQQQKKGNDNPIFSNNMMEIIGILATKIGQIAVLLVFIVLILTAVSIDVVMGTLALSLSFEYDIPFGNGVISADFMAAAISWFTSGIQTFLLLMWQSGNRKMQGWEKWIMIGIVVIDSLIDMTGVAYLLTNQSSRTFTLAGFNLFDYMILLLGTGACAIAENLVIYIAGLRTSGRTIKDLLKARKK